VCTVCALCVRFVGVLTLCACFVCVLWVCALCVCLCVCCVSVSVGAHTYISAKELPFTKTQQHARTVISFHIYPGITL
jgi:hypothetical protein